MSRNNYSNPNAGAPDVPGGNPSGSQYATFDAGYVNTGASMPNSASFDIPQGYVVTPTRPADGTEAEAPFIDCGTVPPTETIDTGMTEVVTDTACKSSIRLVVGWLVCISGPCKGQDFRLHAGWNYVGRDASLDVYLEDNSLSRRGVVKIAYDPETLTFGVAPCEGVTMLARLNNKPLRGDRDFEAYDRLKVGNSELILIPFCSEKFTWEDEQA